MYSILKNALFVKMCGLKHFLHSCWCGWFPTVVVHFSLGKQFSFQKSWGLDHQQGPSIVFHSTFWTHLKCPPKTLRLCCIYLSISIHSYRGPIGTGQGLGEQHEPIAMLGPCSKRWMRWFPMVLLMFLLWIVVWLLVVFHVFWKLRYSNQIWRILFPPVAQPPSFILSSTTASGSPGLESVPFKLGRW